jgi:hypothetical protein
MVQTINQRVAAKIEGDFVVFLIGARLNRWWKFLSFFPIARAMSRMVGETKPPVILCWTCRPLRGKLEGRQEKG